MWGYLRNVALGICLTLAVAAVLTRCAKAHDHNNPDQDEWYHSLMQPDVPTVSCCSYADAYYADEIHVRDGQTYATITDDRPDEPLGRPHVENGSEYLIPPNKLKWDKGNPTGHNVLFISRAGYTWCFVMGAGT
jgi:hypothetical protein